MPCLLPNATALPTNRCRTRTQRRGPGTFGHLLAAWPQGDLIFIHFRDNFEQLNQVELDLAQLPIYDFLELRHSYVSVVSWPL